MTEESNEAERLEQVRRELARTRGALTERVRALEDLVLALWAAAVAAVLVVGLLVPYFAEQRADSDGDLVDERYSILTSVRLVGFDSGPEKLIGVGFLGLVLCTAVAVVTLLLLLSREQGRALSVTCRLVAALMGIGALVPLILSATALGGDGDAAPGALIFALGVLLYAVTLSPPFARLRRTGDESGA